ncbi:hypothetical protein ACRS6Y_15270 [Bacillus cytotoxicus]|uniref:hypothetical protein n=1 Tax=Bacillus cytotoxicus TaxID=580165 RepID=UPI003D7D1DE7
MAFIFTPSEPIKYSQFNYEKFLDYVVNNSTLRDLSFIDDWKKFWKDKLQKEDETVQEYIKQNSDTNPLLIRAKQHPEQFKNRNEMYLYVYRSGHGEDFYFHFDIEKINDFIRLQEPTKLTLKLDDFYIDPDTKYSDNNVQDQRLPFFAPMFTIDKPYILIDGNKRVTARINKGIRSFECYEIHPNILMQSFFTKLEMWFYTLLYETKLFTILLYEGKTSEEIRRYSNAFN